MVSQTSHQNAFAAEVVESRRDWYFVDDLSAAADVVSFDAVVLSGGAVVARLVVVDEPLLWSQPEASEQQQQPSEPDVSGRRVSQPSLVLVVAAIVGGVD